MSPEATVAKIETPEAIQAKVESVPFWWHRIQVAPGIVTPGQKQTDLAAWDALRVPELKGKTVLDIGAWDGFYSFEAERRGAKRVLALDHYAWCIDSLRMWNYYDDCRRRKVVPQQYDTLPGIWDPDRLPGKDGFDLARKLLGSKVESHVDDFMAMDVTPLGVFDVVLYLGVLYHMRNPVEAMMRVGAVTREVAIIETVAVTVPGYEGKSLWEFYPGNELSGDVTNWWAPSEKSLVGLCHAAGFRKVDIIVGPPDLKQHPLRRVAKLFTGNGRTKQPVGYRAVVHAWK